MTPRDEYVRAVGVVRVIDGDTFVADVDLAFHITIRMSCRLTGVNTPERGQPGWAEARDELAHVLGLGPVTVRSVKADKYAGRFDADVVVTPTGDPFGPVDVASWLVGAGVAVRWDGTGPRPAVPWPPPKGVTA